MHLNFKRILDRLILSMFSKRIKKYNLFENISGLKNTEYWFRIHPEYQQFF